MTFLHYLTDPALPVGAAAGLAAAGLWWWTAGRRRHAGAADGQDYRITFEQAAAGIAHTTLDGRILRFNRRYADILGYAPEALAGRNFMEFSHPDDLEAGLAQARRILAGEINACVFEKRYWRRDGATVWCELTVSARRGRDGEVQNFIVVINDIGARKAAEAALAESRRHLELALRAGGLCVWECTPRTGTLRLSEAARQLLELADAGSDLSIAAFMARVHAGDRPLLRRQAAGRQRFQVEFRFLLPDGAERWLQGLGDWLVAEDGAARWIGVARDISASRQADEALRRACERMELAIDAAEQGTWDWDAGSGKIWLTSGVARIFGLPPGPAPQDMAALLACVHPEDRAALDARIEAIWRSGQTQQMECRIVRPDGEVRWLTALGRPVRDGAGRIVRMIGLTADVTQRQQMQMALMESEGRFRATFEQAPVGICHIAPDGHFLRFNRKLAEIAGYDDETLSRLTVQAITHPDDLAADARHRAELVDGHQQAYSLEKRVLRRDGQTVWVKVTATAVRDAAGHFRHFISISEDISERRRAEEALARLAGIVAASNDAIYSLSLDDDPLVTSWNPGAAGLFGHTAEVIVGRPVTLLLPEAQQVEQRWIMEEVRAGRGVDNLETVRRRRDGSLLDVSLSVAPLRDSAGRVTGASCIVRDMTRRKQDEKTLRLQRQAIESSQNGILIVDVTQPEQPVIYANPAFETITGYAAAEIVGRNCRFLQNGDGGQAGLEEIRQAIRERREGRALLRNYRKDGRLFYNELLIAPVRAAGGEVTHFVGALNDRTEQHDYEAQLEFQATHDPLTHLPNRILLGDRLHQAVAWARRHRQPIAVICIDLDRFKRVNDSSGHSAGDALLREVAARLTGSLRETDTVARLGGDEFVIVARGLHNGADEAALLARRLLKAVSAPFAIDGQAIAVTCSVGVAVWPRDGTDAETLLKHADIAMYRAKEQGRDRFGFYDPGMNQALLARVAMERDLRAALARDEFALHYQPVADLASGAIIGTEALLAWEDPARGRLPSEAFLAVAEEAGLLRPLGEWVLWHACRQNRQWQQAGLPNLFVSVNVSTRLLRDPGFRTMVEATLARAELAPRALVLEWSEAALSRDPDALSGVLRGLRDQGVGLVIDNFGVGYSGLDQLRSLPIDGIKLSADFIRHLVSDPADAAIVIGLIAMAHRLGLTVTATGVDVRAQMDYLRKHHCDRIQGICCGPPLDAAGAGQFLFDRRHAGLDLREDDPAAHRLLIVDDEPNIVAALRRLLRDEGYEILTAHNAARALELLATHAVGVVLTDQRMPGMSGTEFLARVRELHPATMRIVLSGYTDLNAVTAAINHGAAYKFLTKPWDNDELRETLRDAFRRYRRAGAPT